MRDRERRLLELECIAARRSGAERGRAQLLAVGIDVTTLDADALLRLDRLAAAWPDHRVIAIDVLHAVAGA